MNAKNFIIDLKKIANKDPENLAILSRFFKTGPGQYGEGDVFIGVRVPQLRQVCKQYITMSLPEIDKLLASPIHEVRLGGAVVMAMQAASKKFSPEYKKALYELYMQRAERMNNWDIVDLSCRDVVGSYLFDKPRKPLYDLAKSDNVWKKRIAIVSTWYFIREKQLDDTFAIAEILLHDKHDLIRKATGWMLREAGKKDEHRLRQFLDKHAAVMPRTILRYAIERFDEPTRKHYMLLKTR